MRWVFLSLLFANIALFVWHWFESDRQQRLQALNASVMNQGEEMPGEPLVLIRELDEQQFEELLKREPEQDTPVEPLASEAPAVDEEPSADEPSASQEPSANKEPSADKEPSTDKEAGEELSANTESEASQDSVAANQPPSAETLPLEDEQSAGSESDSAISEPPAPEATADSDQETTDAEADTVATPAQVADDASAEIAIPEGSVKCTLLGPIEEVQHGEQIVERLMALGIEAGVEEIDISAESEYWVIIPSFETKKEALQTIRELQGKDIESFLITKGDMANSVSLGLYSSEENAEKRKEEMTLHGYNVEVRVKARVYKENWVALHSEEAAKLNDAVWLGIQEDFPNLDKRPSFCEAEPVASGDNIQ